MEEFITIQPNDKTKKILSKESDRTCSVEIFKRGTYKGIIEKLYSNGKYDVTLIEKIEEAKE